MSGHAFRKRVTAKELAERDKISRLSDPPTPQPQHWAMDEEAADTSANNTTGPSRRGTRSMTVAAPAVEPVPPTVSGHIYIMPFC